MFFIDVCYFKVPDGDVMVDIFPFGALACQGEMGLGWRVFCHYPVTYLCLEC